MNYGKFFKLNLEESKIVDKIAIYDYIDLPAYEGNPKPMSPKYPVSLRISQDALRFCLHYCAYYEEKTETFSYEIGDDQKNIETVHLQEVILEIPFANNSMQSVSNAIKELYINFFPSVSKSGKDSSYAFLNQLLNQRFRKIEELTKEEKAKRLNLDKNLSYSSLWLMGLRKEGGYLNIKDKDENYVGFMRKLLLDFMFDLKHSEVFQTSAFFQQMYSGLMSDFYFSALMHKCEYYYYRRLTLDAIAELEKQEVVNKDYKEGKNDKEGEIKSENKEKTDRKKLIRELYASQLFEAEKTWVEDITNPLAEQLFRPSEDDFETQNEESFCKRVKKYYQSILDAYKKKSLLKWLKKCFNKSSFTIRDDWFADPEEELRRVCFTMEDFPEDTESSKAKDSQETKNSPEKTDSPEAKDSQETTDSSKKGVKHMCNSEAVAEYFNIQKQDGIADLRSHISRWFLKRNAFAEVLHLHLFKFAHIVVPIIVFALTVIILCCPSFFNQETCANPLIIGSAVIIWLIITGIAIYWVKKPFVIEEKSSNTEVLSNIRKRLVAKRMLWWMMVDGAFLLLVIAAIYGNTNSLWIKILPLASGVVLLAALCIKNRAHIKLVKNVHLLLPRLVASIAAAWLTIAIGNELFQSFFDALPSWITCGILSGVVLFFILYEMNKIIPRESGEVKFIRGFEMLVISYLISIVVGLFIINFTGERFLERSEYLRTFHVEYLTKENTTEYQQVYHYTGDSLKDSTNMEYLKSLKNLTVVRKGQDHTDNRPVVTYWDMHFLHDYQFFILRDFLIQFAFLAMFIGVFIQMIFEEKSITDM